MLGGAARFLLYAGLAGAVGGLVTAFLLSRVGDVGSASLPRERADAQLGCRRFWLTGLVVIGIVTLVRAWLQVDGFRDPTDPFWPLARRVLGETSWGYGFWLQLSGLALSWTGAGLGVERGWRPGFLTVIGATGLIVAPAWQGHAAGIERLVALSIGADAIHTAAFAAWIGTLAGIWLTFLGGSGGDPNAENRAAITRTLIVRFSPLALTCGVVLALTGTIAALLHLTAVADLWGSVWGRWLIAKLAAVAAVTGAGAYNWRIVTPRLRTSGGLGLLRAGIRRELVFATVVLILTAILTGTGTPGSE